MPASSASSSTSSTSSSTWSSSWSSWSVVSPLCIPWRRRMQTLAVLAMLLTPWMSLATTIALVGGYVAHAMDAVYAPAPTPTLTLAPALALVFYPLLAYITYATYRIVIQRAHHNPTGAWTWFRECVWFRYFVAYFPVRVHAPSSVTSSSSTASASPFHARRSYVFGYHPHGIISLGALSTFAMRTTAFPRLFPALTTHLVTLDAMFYVPFYSTILLWLGICSSSSACCRRVLARGGGSSLAIVIGGARESLDGNYHYEPEPAEEATRSSRRPSADATSAGGRSGGTINPADSKPPIMYLHLAHRKGFVRLALEHGAALVPCFGFGELDVYHQLHNPRGSWLRRVQNWLQRRLGFATPVILGRGVFQYVFGLMPYRRPIDVHVGEPIDCPKVPREELTQELVDRFHQKYLVALFSLFDEHKHKYAHLQHAQLRLAAES